MNAEFRELPVHDITSRSCLEHALNFSAGPSFLIILLIDSARYGIVPRLRTSPSSFANCYGDRLGRYIQTKIVTSFMTGFLSRVALDCAFFRNTGYSRSAQVTPY